MAQASSRTAEAPAVTGRPTQERERVPTRARIGVSNVEGATGSWSHNAWIGATRLGGRGACGRRGSRAHHTTKCIAALQRAAPCPLSRTLQRRASFKKACGGHLASHVCAPPAPRALKTRCLFGTEERMIEVPAQVSPSSKRRSNNSSRVLPLQKRPYEVTQCDAAGGCAC